MNEEYREYIETVAGGDIPTFSVGDMRLLNLEIPVHLADGPDDAMMVTKRDFAEANFADDLVRWRIPEDEAQAFKASAGAFEIMRVIQIHVYLRIIFRENDPFDWLHRPNKSFDEKTPWSVIREGDIEAVFRNLDGHIFGAWSPHINPFALMEKKDDE